MDHAIHIESRLDRLLPSVGGYRPTYRIAVFTYLTFVFKRLPHLKTVEDYEALLPWNVKAALRPPSQPANAVDHAVA